MLNFVNVLKILLVLFGNLIYMFYLCGIIIINLKKQVMKNFEECFGEKTFTIFDGYCGEPIKWGRKVVKRVGEEDFDLMRRAHNIEYISDTWMVIDRTLSREEAIKLYGEITDEEYGPRGGWKSVTFGDKRFNSKEMKERKY